MSEEPEPELDQTREAATTDASRNADTRCGAKAAEETYAFLDRPRAPGELGRLGHHRILKRIGSGGMGIVFLGEDTRLRRQVALKVMLPVCAADRIARERFQREARAAAAVKHDHIVTIYEVGEENGIPFIAMEHLRGMPLDVYLKKVGTPSLAQAIHIAREAAEGLAAAHEQGLIHRDIKPANLWLEAPRGRVKILDFGLARPTDPAAGLTMKGAPVGTPSYMSPEQAREDPLDHRTDLFSLGCVLYRLCAGRPAFHGATMTAVLHSLAVDNPPPARSLNPKVPQGLSDLIDRLLAKDPDGRPASAREVVQLLRDFDRPGRPGGPEVVFVPMAVPVQADVNPWEGIDEPPVAARPVQARSDRASTPRHWPLAVALSGALVLFAVAVVVFRARPPAPGPEKKDDGPAVAPVAKAVDPDRRAAEWVLKLGGRAEARQGQNAVALQPGKPLPEGTFTVTVIDLHGVAAVTDAGLANLRGLKHLAALDLSGTAVTQTGLATLRDLPSLNSLTLYCPRLTDDGLKQLKGLRLARLFFSSDLVTDAGLAHLEGMPLTYLNAGGQITDTGLRALAGFRGLQFLGIGSGQITDAGLTALPEYPELLVLSLYGPGLGDAAVAGYARRLPRLNALQLYHVPVTANGLKLLEMVPGLHRLELTAPNAVSEADVRTFQQARPHCAVSLDGTQYPAPSPP